MGDTLPSSAKPAIRVAGACLLLVVVLDLLAALQVAGTHQLAEELDLPEKPPGSVWQQTASEPGSLTGSNRRRLTIQLDRKRLTVSYDLWTPIRHPVFEAVRQGRAEVDPARLIVELFGEVHVGEFPYGLPNSAQSSTTPLSFGAPVIDASTHTGHVQVRAKPYETTLPRLQLMVEPPEASSLWLSSDVVRVRSDSGLQVLSRSGPPPVWQSDTTAEFNRSARPGAELSFAVVDRSEDTFRATLQRVGGTTLPVVDFSLWWLLGLPPFVLVFLLLGGAGRSLTPVGDHLRRIVGLLLAFAAAIPLLGILVDASWSLGPYARPLAAWLLQDPAGTATRGQAGALAVTLLAAALIWPVAVVRAHRSSLELAHRRSSSPTIGPLAGRGARLQTAVAALAVGTATAAVAGWGAWQNDAASGVRVGMLVATAVLATLSFLLARFLIGTLLGPRRATTLAVIAALAANGVALAYPLFYDVHADRHDLGRLGLFLLAAGILLVSYALFAGWATAFLVVRGAPRRWSAAVAGVVALTILVLAVPDTIALVVAPAPNREAGLWSLLGVATALGSVAAFLLLACLLLALKRLSGLAERAQPVQVVRQAGIVFAVVTFYWWQERWLYLPISLLLGWLYAATIALPRGRGPAQTEAFAQRVMQRVRQHQQDPPAPDGSRDGLPQAAVTPTASRAPAPTAKAAQPTPTGSLDRPVPAGDLQRRLLRGGGWSHGRQAALWGLLLGAPFSVLYLWEIGKAAVPPSDYEALDFVVGTALWIVLQWALYGLFFGYFYPHLRGISGVPKALNLFGLVVVPPLFYHALWSPQGTWQAYGLFVLQMFVFSMLLGVLAGDYLLLRRVHLGWQEFVEVHNLRVVLTWGSSVAVALAGIITTVVTTGASAVVSALLEQAGIGGGAGPSSPRGP